MSARQTLSSAPWRAAAIWLAVLAVATAGLIVVRPSLDRSHVAMMLLLVVLGGSAAGGRLLGATLAFLSFFLFNWFFLPPYSTLALANPLDWLVLIAFLVTGIVAAQLLYVARNEARAALERAREIDRLASLMAAVSHDLRTPLTAIKALAHDLSAFGDERSEIIEQEADRLHRLVTDLLDISRLDAGAMPVRIEVNAVDDLLGALSQRVESAIGADRLRVTLPPDDALLCGHFDFVHTLRIVANLVDNAAKYSPAGSPIDVATRREDDRLVIAVSDRGAGVPTSELGRMFDPFHRPPGTPADVSGVGLGLSISHRLAAAQRGKLEYEARDGGGSTFILTLRAADLPIENGQRDLPR